MARLVVCGTPASIYPPEREYLSPCSFVLIALAGSFGGTQSQHSSPFSIPFCPQDSTPTTFFRDCPPANGPCKSPLLSSSPCRIPASPTEYPTSSLALATSSRVPHCRSPPPLVPWVLVRRLVPPSPRLVAPYASASSPASSYASSQPRTMDHQSPPAKATHWAQKRPSSSLSSACGRPSSAS